VALSLLLGLCSQVSAQQPSTNLGTGTAAESVAKKLAERVQRGVENKTSAEAEKNFYRGGVESQAKVKQNMQELFKKVLVQSKEQADPWYSPHLRDARIEGESRNTEVDVRAKTIPLTGYRNIIDYCMNPWNWPIEAACPLTAYNLLGEVCYWHGQPGTETYYRHRPVGTCFGLNTEKYFKLREDWNFKTCCVKKGQEGFTTEEVLSIEQNRDGGGWAGMYEFYFPATVIGWENDRTTTMIVEKSKVASCLNESNKLLSQSNGQQWVSAAIRRNVEAVQGNATGVGEKVRDNINAVRPKESYLQNTDSLQNEGLTVRPNFAALDSNHREQLATRYCMHPRQFDKIMDAVEDPVQRPHAGLENIKVWSNYCPEGVTLMTDPEKSDLDNIDFPLGALSSGNYSSYTNFKLGMAAWRKDPLYCQRMNLGNPNMDKVGFGDVIRKSNEPALRDFEVGYTCRVGDPAFDSALNGGMVPVTFGRHAAIERRTAIGDHVLGFLIAAGLDKSMRLGQKSYYKRFEPRPYSRNLDSRYAMFKGKPVRAVARAGVSNERGTPCQTVAGEDFYETRSDKGDRLYISDLTHKPFTQDIVEEDPNSGRLGADRYVQEWAKTDNRSKADIAKRRESAAATPESDRATSNYATAFRIFASCPKGYVRWRPPPDVHNQGLVQNLDNFCGEEWLGGNP
jgi:hypothetical protein